jgi:hypothetical protein
MTNQSDKVSETIANKKLQRQDFYLFSLKFSVWETDMHKLQITNLVITSIMNAKFR